MKVLHIISHLRVGGAEKIVIALTNELRKNGHDVTLCYRKSDSLDKLLKDVDLLALPGDSLIDGKYLFNLYKYIRDRNIDIIHSHIPGRESVLYGCIVAIITRSKFILTIHGNIYRKRTIKLILWRIIFQFADSIVTVSEMIKAEFLKRTNISPKKLVNITNGIDISHYGVRIDPIVKRKELNISNDFFLIGAVGNIKHVKGYDILLKSLHLIKEIKPNVKLLIAGEVNKKIDIKFMYELKKLISELNIEEDVVFLGSRKDINEILSLIDVFVLPSRSEGTSISLLEAMASGKGIVATAVGGTPNIIIDKANGLLVQPDDPEALANAVLSLLNDSSLALRLGNRARRDAETKYSLQMMIEKYQTLYRDILKL
ncbi:MAG: glycosyltransferase [Candidatus Dadabacteria bacterium]|nr:glycosyltransferase [Candidatus Dadabacteria bacterium]